MRGRHIFGAFVVMVLVAAACVSVQRPVTFVTSAGPSAGIDVVARTLAAVGTFAPDTVDRQANVVMTRWNDTGYPYGTVQAVPASIVRRFVVSLSADTEGTTVGVRIEAKRCPHAEGYTAGSVDIERSCEEESTLPDRFHTELEVLAARLEQALKDAAASAPIPAASVPPAPAPAPPPSGLPAAPSAHPYVAPATIPLPATGDAGSSI